MCESDKLKEIKSIISTAPKPQLHLHLDGSLSFEFISASLKRLKVRNKITSVFNETSWEPSTEEELVTWLRNLKKGDQEKGWNVASTKNWHVFDICNMFLQTKLDLFEATYDLVTRLARQHNVNYMEIRFAPVLHTNEGLSEKEAVDAVLHGFTKAAADLSVEHSHVTGGVILCGLRSYPPSEMIKTVEMIRDIDDDRVLGFDIAGDEKTYPLKLFEQVIRLAIDSNIKVTVHAGEWNGKANPDVINNLKLAVDLGVNRIGHGLALDSLKENDEIFTRMIANNISVEVCLTGNCSNREKCATFREHPLRKFLKSKVRIAGLNVDNLLLSGNHELGCPDPSGEVLRAVFECGVTSDQLLEIIEGSYLAAFKALPTKFIEGILGVWKEKILPFLYT